MIKNKNPWSMTQCPTPTLRNIQDLVTAAAGTQGEAEQSARGAEVGSGLLALDPVDFPSLQSPRDACAYFLDAFGPDFDTVLHAPHAQE